MTQRVLWLNGCGKCHMLVISPTTNQQHPFSSPLPTKFAIKTLTSEPLGILVWVITPTLPCGQASLQSNLFSTAMLWSWWIDLVCATGRKNPLGDYISSPTTMVYSRIGHPHCWCPFPPSWAPKLECPRQPRGHNISYLLLHNNPLQPEVWCYHLAYSVG